MKYLLDAMDDMGIDLSESTIEYVPMIEDAVDLRDGQPFPMEYLGPLRKLWGLMQWTIVLKIEYFLRYIGVGPKSRPILGQIPLDYRLLLCARISSLCRIYLMDQLVVDA